MKSVIRHLVSLVCIPLLLCSCTYNYTKDTAKTTLGHARLAPSHSVKRQSQWVMHPVSRVALAKPALIKKGHHNRALTALASDLELALKQVFPAFSALEQTPSFEAALLKSHESRSEFLFWPELVLSENNLNTLEELTEGQELHPKQDYGPDRVAFQVRIYEVRTGKMIDLVHISSRARFLAGNDSLPPDLFKEAATEFSYAITGKSPTH